MLPKSFHINARHYFLTWPQCNEDKHDVHKFLKGIQLVQCVSIAQELHQDGHPHLHAVVSFSKKKNIKNARFFDYEGAHCNIQACKSLQDSLDYIQKEDTEAIIEHKSEASWDTIVNDCTSKEEFYKAMQTNYPRDYVLNKQRLDYYADQKWPIAPSTWLAPGWAKPSVGNSAMEGWVKNALNPIEGERTKTLVLIGPTRLGKTYWARSRAPHLYFNDAINMRQWWKTDKSHYAIVILDDVPLEKVNPFKAIIGCQASFNAKVLYHGHPSISHGKPVIWLCNDDPREDMSPAIRAWFEGNSEVIYITSPLF